MALTRDFAEVEPDETPTFLSFKSAKVLIPLAFSTSTVTWSVKYGVVKSQLSFLSSVYVELIQNTPLLLQICFLYYALAFSGHSLGILTTGILSLGIYHGAYMAEVVRAGIEAIPKGQFEAAYAQGFGYIGRMYYIILPQSIKIILPPMVNQVVNLIKNTSCLYIIGGSDLISLTYSFVTGAQTGGAYAPAYLVSGFLFFLICFPLSKAASVWENNLKKRDRRTTTDRRKVA